MRRPQSANLLKWPGSLEEVYEHVLLKFRSRHQSPATMAERRFCREATVLVVPDPRFGGGGAVARFLL